MTWYDTNYQYKKKITIDHTKCGASDASSFPALISWTDADFKTSGNGGKVQNSSGFDIIFTPSTEDSKLDHEIEKYVSTTGEMEFWVRIPTLSHTADTVIYVYFDNSTISTSQENVHSVWDSNYKAVWHLKETAGTSGSIKDSTSNANNGTPYTNYSSTIGDISTSSGQIDGAQSFNGSSHSITAASSASLDIGAINTATFSAWIKRAASNSIGDIIAKLSLGSKGYYVGIGTNAATTNQVDFVKAGVFEFAGGSFPADTNFHYVVCSADASGMYITIDNTRSTNGNTSNFSADNTDTLFLGNGSAAYFNGTIDEVRISTATRSTDWITAEWNNQNSPSTFYSVGALTSQSTTTNRDITARLRLQATRLRDIGARVIIQTVSIRDIPSRLRLQAQSLRDVASRTRLQVTVARDMTARLRVQILSVRDVTSRLIMRATSLRDLSTRLILNSGLVLKDLSARLVVARNPSEGIVLTPLPQPFGFASPGTTLPSIAKPLGLYSLVLADQPTVRTSPQETSGVIPVGSTFTLTFVSPTVQTQQLLANGNVVMLSFALANGSFVVGEVKVTSSTLTVQNIFIVTLVVVATIFLV